MDEETEGKRGSVILVIRSVDFLGLVPRSATRWLCDLARPLTFLNLIVLICKTGIIIVIPTPGTVVSV